MKHLKIYEEYEPTEHDNKISNMKRLLSHLTKMINELGFDYTNYFDKQKWQVEFNVDNKYIFYISVEHNYFSGNIVFKIKTPPNVNHVVDFIPDYFENINGINNMIFDGSYTYEYEIKYEDVDNVINQITINDFKFKLNANKYNL